MSQKYRKCNKKVLERVIDKWSRLNLRRVLISIILLHNWKEQYVGSRIFLHIPEGGSCPGAFPAGLRQWRVGGYPCPPNAPTPVGSDFWMQRHDWSSIWNVPTTSQTHSSAFTGCGSWSAYSIRLQYWATKSFTIPRRDTWDHSLVLLTYLVDEHFALPAPIAWKYLISNFTASAAELFRLSPHRSGTHYKTQSFRHQHCCRSSTNWKLFYFNDPLFISTVIMVSQ